MRVIADGLLNPRGVTISRDGAVYVAEAGVGGPTAAEVPGGGPSGSTLCFGKTGGVTRVQHSSQRRVVRGLPSYSGASENGTCDPAAIGFAATGPHDVVVDHPNTMLIAMGLGAPPNVRGAIAQDISFAGQLGTVKRVRPYGGDRTMADLAAYEGVNDPDGAGPDSNPYSVAALRGGATLVVDAGANALLRVGANGRINTVATFPDAVRPVPALSCPAPPDFPPVGTPIPSQAVPTSVVVGPDGAFYVGQLTGFPFAPGAARVFRVDPRTGHVSTFADGFSAIVDIAFAPDGSLYVLEIARAGLLEAEVCGNFPGRLVKVSHGKKSEVQVPGLEVPGGLAVAKDGTIYISNRGILPGGAGQLLKVTPRRGH
ncbi:ScyD/ScyE family protein [Micromonospora sp. URMC 103]|uniref:ScyD/ScyE family protein n=1 Tax=Micromonospora sp. URMC 103 TaxID=3423406 RepID=UPI003F1CC7E0